MSDASKRFVVSDLGFAFAVYDTRAPADYNFVAGQEKEHRSSNRLNSVRVGLFTTHEEAVRFALELEQGSRAG